MKDDFSLKTPLTTTDQTHKPKMDKPVTDLPVIDPPKHTGNKTSFDKAKLDAIDKPTMSTYSGTTLLEDLSEGPTKVAKVKTTDYGDIVKAIMDVLSRDYLNDGSLKSMMGSSLFPVSGDNPGGKIALDRIQDGFMKMCAADGPFRGALGRLMGSEITYEREPLKNEASLSKIPPLTLQKPLPPYWEFNSAANYASDCADRKKDAKGLDKDVNTEAQKHRHLAVSQQVNGKMGKIQVDFQSLGVQTVNDDGTLGNNTGPEASGYEAILPGKGNAIDARNKLEKARFVKAKVEKQGDKYVMTVQSGCDVVRSGWDGKNMGPAGQKIVKQFAGHEATVQGESTKVTMTANDVLSVTRAYAEARHHNRMMIADALVSNPDLAPDLLSELKAAGTDPKKLDAFFAKAEKDGRLANVGIEMPETITLGRRGQDGQWHALVGSDGKPVTISRTDLEVLMHDQLIKNTAANDPSSTITEPPQSGSTVDDQNGAALGENLTMTVKDTKGNSSTSKDVDLGKDVSEPATEDEGVRTLVSHTDSRDDVATLQENADNVDNSLQQVADQFSDGSLQIKDLNAQQQKQLADALNNYLRVKDANAAKKFTQLLASMMKGGEVGTFISGVVKRLNASVRLNTAIDQLPPKLRIFANPSHMKPKDGLTIGGTDVPVSHRVLEGPPSVMHAKPDTLDGAKTIFSGVITTQLPKLQTSSLVGKAAEDRTAALKRLTEDFNTSSRLRQAATTIGAAIADQLAAGKKPDDIAAALTKELFPNEASPPTLTITLDGGSFHLTMTPNTDVLPTTPMQTTKSTVGDYAKTQLQAGKKPEDIAKALSSDLYPNAKPAVQLEVVKHGDQVIVRRKPNPDETISLLTHDRPTPKPTT